MQARTVLKLMEEFNISHKEYDLVTFLYENLSEDKISILLFEHKITGESIYDLVIKIRDIEEEKFLKWLAKKRNITFLDLTKIKFEVDHGIIHELGAYLLTDNAILPIKCETCNYLVMHNFRKEEYEKVNILFDHVLSPAIATKAQILEILHRIERKDSLKEISKKLIHIGDEWPDYTKTFWDTVFAEAIEENVSDIHLSPSNHYVTIKFRNEGSLFEKCILHIKYWESLIVRLKVLAKMDINETRLPQDGSLSIRSCGKEIDFRISSHPTIYGENIVIRMLHNNGFSISLPLIGYSIEQQELIKSVVTKKSGATIITGPTGSGKTTTVYTLLKMFDPSLNIMTLEDPVEYRIKNIMQTDVSKANNLSYSDGIKSLMRQDPDVIFVGEIRDAETARMVARASMTGHHVVSTMHTDNAIEVFNRFDEFGISLKWIASHVNIIISQKLVRQLCDCKKEYEIDHGEAMLLDLPLRSRVYTNAGCSQCQNGYTKRTVIAEMLKFDSEFAEFIVSNPKNISRYLKMNKLKTLREEIINKLRLGLISINDAKSLIR